MVRQATNDLITAVEEGMLTWEDVARTALQYMSEAEVRDMVDTNDMLAFYEDGEY